MGATAVITNKGENTYTEEFKGRTVTLKPGDTVTMPRHEAQEFMGTMSRALPNGGWTEKKMVINVHPEEDNEKEKFICQVDGQEFKNKADLEKHLTTAHRNQPMVKDK